MVQLPFQRIGIVHLCRKIALEGQGHARVVEVTQPGGETDRAVGLANLDHARHGEIGQQVNHPGHVLPPVPSFHALIHKS